MGSGLFHACQSQRNPNQLAANRHPLTNPLRRVFCCLKFFSKNIRKRIDKTIRARIINSNKSKPISWCDLPDLPRATAAFLEQISPPSKGGVKRPLQFPSQMRRLWFRRWESTACQERPGQASRRRFRRSKRRHRN